MKKILIALSICFSLSLGAFAKEYTLEVYGNPNNNAPTVNVPTIPSQSPRGNGFCESFGKGFSDAVNPRSTTRAAGFIAMSSFDPYMIEIDGARYMLIKDNNDGVYDKNDILGYKDSIYNIFVSLKPLDINRDNKLTGEELTNGGVRLVKISPDGKLAINDKTLDYDNNNIKFIYIKELRKAYTNNGSTGNFGLFDVLIKQKGKSSKLVTGIVTFETEQEINNYF